MAGFQVDMSPLVNSSRSIGNAYGNIGQNLGNTLANVGQLIGEKNEQSQQQDAQTALNDLSSRAMGGDVEAFQQLMTQSPQDAQRVAQYLQQQQAGGDASRLAANKEVVKKLHMLQRQDMTEEQRTAEYNKLIANPDDDFDADDIPYLSDPKNLQQLSVEFFGADESQAMFGTDNGLSDQPSAVQETEWFNKQSPEVQETHLKIKRGEKPSLDEKLDYEKSKAEIKEDSAISEARTKTQNQRRQGYIDSGVSSADNLMTVNRSIALLDEIKTGGIDNAMIRAKQMFGIESGDEAELSYELGKSVLKQLKPTFGAAFTVNEMLELKRMEAGLGKSVAGNRRILANLAKMIQRSADRGMRAAENLGDDFAASEIRLALEGGKPVEEVPTEIEEPANQNQYSEGMTATGPSGEIATFINGQWVVQ